MWCADGAGCLLPMAPGLPSVAAADGGGSEFPKGKAAGPLETPSTGPLPPAHTELQHFLLRSMNRNWFVCTGARYGETTWRYVLTCMISHSISSVSFFFSFKQVADAFLFAENVVLHFQNSKSIEEVQVWEKRHFPDSVEVLRRSHEPCSLIAPEEHNRISEAMALCYWGDWVPSLGCPNPPKICEAPWVSSK